jgi:type VI secretion system protein ImpL
MGTLSAHFWQWIAALGAAVLSLVGGYFAFPAVRRGLRKLGWWLVPVAIAGLAVVFLTIMPRRYPAADLPDSALPPFLHDGYWAWMFVFVATALGSAATLVRTARSRRGAAVAADEAGAAWPELDAAWDEILVRLAQARIDPSAQRVYLILAPDEERAAEVVRSSGLQVFVEAPAAPAPVHAYATSDGLLLTCAGASGLGGAPGRMGALCRKLIDLQPDCPVVRGVVVVFPMPWSSDPGSVAQAAAVREDLLAVRRAVKIACPVFAVFSGMETTPGLTEFAARLASQVNARMLDQRVGFAVPETEAFSGDLVQRGLTWLAGWLHSWTLNLLAGDPLNYPGNGRLVTLDFEFRRYRKRLRAILESAFSTHRDSEPVVFRGCYFLATGDERDARAFAAGLFRGPTSRVVADHIVTTWGKEAEAEDRRYRRLALAVGVLGGALILATWAYIISLTAIGWLGLGTLAVTWGFALARLMRRA